MEYKKYYIKVDYRDGDSAGTYDYSLNLELRWNNMDVAKANIKRIKDHYEWYLKQYKSDVTIPRPACVDKENDRCLYLLTDDCVNFKMAAPWVGWCASLDKAQIFEATDPGTIYLPTGFGYDG